MMSTTSGFVLGVLASATLTVLYGEQLSNRLQDAIEHHPRVAAQIEEVASRATLEDLAELAPTAQRIVTSIEERSTLPPEQTPPPYTEPAVSTPSEDISAAQLPETAPLDTPEIEAPERDSARSSTVQNRQPPQSPQTSLEKRWAEYARNASELDPAGDYPWRACFKRAAASYALPEALLLAIASGESNFDPAARSDKDAIGLMQVRWPVTSRHLGVLREADLYDPCTNVDAGARYLLELAGQYDNNYHLAVAAYNYGPSRIGTGEIPAGAAWYSQYIFQHLQQVLGRDHIPTSDLIQRPARQGAGHQVLMSFNQSYRARDYLAFLRAQFPDLNLQQQSEALGLHDVVLLYQNETERREALRNFNAAGIATLNPQSEVKLYL